MKNRRLPDFILIGGAKCGSTSLFEYLRTHPEISASKSKEPHYFTKNWSKGINWYKSQFRDSANLMFEGSTSYSNYPWYKETPKRMKEVIPSAKLVYIVRHPIDRLVSQVHHNMLMGRLSIEEVSSEEFWINGGAQYIYLSMYHMQVVQYLKYFDRSKLHVLTLEELSANPQVVLTALTEFLEISPYFFDKGNNFEKHNVSKERWKSKRGILQKGVRFLRRKGVIESAIGGIDEKIQRPEFSDKSIEYIWAQIDDDLGKFKNFIGRDIGYGVTSKSMKH